MNPKQSPIYQQRKPQNNTVILLIAVVAVFLIIGIIYTCNRQKKTTEKPPFNNGTATQELQIPAVASGDQIINHTGYTLCFVPQYEQASWVAYVLRGSQLQSAHFSRTNQFMTDPMAKPHSADDEDYEASGYDRGHLASAEDMSWSATTMKESFYYSNMSPQLPAFNRGVWKRLEELVRYWSSAYDSIYVVTGPVLTEGLPSIGHDKVAVPHYYYKVILEYNATGVKGVGFVLPNEPSAATLKSFAVSIDSVEHLTGLDFFPKLPNDVEEKVESNVNVDDWLWTRKKKQSSVN